MKQIEFYQLAFYFGKGLNLIVLKKGFKIFNIKLDDYYIKDMAKAISLNKYAIIKDGEICNPIYFDEFKPVLKSILDISERDLTELFKMFGDLFMLNDENLFKEVLLEQYRYLDTLPLRVCIELAKRGYDIFNLLENNLAISEVKNIDLSKHTIYKYTENQIQELINIGSKTEWKYPEKGEYPKDKQKVLCVYEAGQNTIQTLEYYFECNKNEFKEHYIAWCELPIYDNKQIK
jgi:hypothetical protein